MSEVANSILYLRTRRHLMLLLNVRNMFWLLCLCVLSKEALTFNSSKVIEGYPGGYMPDCPGSTKEAIITKKSLKELKIVSIGVNSNYRSTFNYFDIKNLAHQPGFDFTKMTILFVSGYMDSTKFILSHIVSNAYRNLGYNIMLLETNLFTTMEYPRASRLVRTVGKHTAKMLADLTQEGLNPKKLEIVSLSLGVQTASFVAKNYKLLTGMNVSRITGLDPSGPCFRNLGPDQRIDKTDADFVDIIATNIDGFGMAAPVGHVNFYVNGGEYQPGLIMWSFCGVVCSHVYSYLIWLSALRHPKSFIAIQCDSVQQARNKECYDRHPQVTNILGLNTDKTKEGIFYLATKQHDPYYLGVKGLRRENDFLMHQIELLNKDDIFTV